MKKKEYIGSDVEYEQDDDKKFRITRGMLILGIIVLIVLIAIIISLRSLVATRKEKETYKEEDFIRLEQRMEEEAPIYVNQKNIELDEEKIKIDLKSLLVENGGSIDPDKNKAVKICDGYVIAYYDEYATYEPYIKCGDKYTTFGYEEKTTVKKTTTTSPKDTLKPDILIVGDAEITLYVGDKYNEPGYSATDNVDGDITSNVKVDGNVDTSKPGTYTLTYMVSDSSGNENTVTRKVIVKEKETTTKVTKQPTTKPPVTTTTTTKKTINPPVITLNGQSEITIIKDSNYDDPGYSAKDCFSKDITRNVVVSGSVNTHLIGQYKITYTVTDSYGLTTTVQRIINVIKENVIRVDGLSLTPNDSTIKVGESYVLVLQISPSNATDKTVVWTISDPSVASISNGIVTGKRPGNAKITVTSSNGKKASATVRVY